MKQKRTIISIMLLLIILGLSACSSKSDPELNKTFSPYASECVYDCNSQYCRYYSDEFQNLSIDTVLLSMGLHWYVEQYDDVYVGKEDYFYISAFDGGSISTNDLLKLYNNSPSHLYFLKPFLDCYLLMDANHKPSEEKLKCIKETILYALDYYINGKDFIGTLE